MVCTSPFSNSDIDVPFLAMFVMHFSVLLLARAVSDCGALSHFLAMNYFTNLDVSLGLRMRRTTWHINTFRI